MRGSRLRSFRQNCATQTRWLGSPGKTAQEAVAEKPFADLDPVWGKGIINSDRFVQIVYLTL
ncbi:MAG TPA: hypothetical protein VN952_09035 [Chthoniobacterales bacterium]|nr:hypothetical protein [Chthoniobacterales bacterium]